MKMRYIEMRVMKNKYELHEVARIVQNAFEQLPHSCSSAASTPRFGGRHGHADTVTVLLLSFAYSVGMPKRYDAVFSAKHFHGRRYSRASGLNPFVCELVIFMFESVLTRLRGENPDDASMIVSTSIANARINQDLKDVI